MTYCDVPAVMYFLRCIFSEIRFAKYSGGARNAVLNGVLRGASNAVLDAVSFCLSAFVVAAKLFKPTGFALKADTWLSRTGLARLSLVPVWRVVFAACVLLWVCATGLQAREAHSLEPAATIALSQLPKQGLDTYQRIATGGPFAYEKDSVVFGNRERLLPRKPRGYYREYTVKTPGESDRGARRIVCGGPAQTPDVCFYTADHYASFRRIVP